GDGNDGVTMGPQILSAPSPSYPESARASNVEGTTVVGLIISVNGNVTSAWVESSSGNSILDQTAVNAVYGWQFVPAKQNGVAVEAQSRVPVSFTLK
ncbi:MAG: energy transducer TonB, partial [Dialister invisus]|nr:energy transducer TonB [Dialister invisus]